MRGATSKSKRLTLIYPYFNPRSSCEERRKQGRRSSRPSSFQSTLLMRGATIVPGLILELLEISIHAPHARSDSPAAVALLPTSPFQSTLLMRGATNSFLSAASFKTISIHAPHARSDWAQTRSRPESGISIHAPHARSDLQSHAGLHLSVQISIHAPHARSDLSTCTAMQTGERFQSTHAPHARSDRTSSPKQRSHSSHFNPRSSCEERLDIASI